MTNTLLNTNTIAQFFNRVFKFSKHNTNGMFIEELQSTPTVQNEETFQREMELIRDASGLIQNELWDMDSYSYQAGNIGNCYVAVIKYGSADDFELHVNYMQFDSVSHAASYIAAENL